MSKVLLREVTVNIKSTNPEEKKDSNILGRKVKLKEFNEGTLYKFYDEKNIEMDVEVKPDLRNIIFDKNLSIDLFYGENIEKTTNQLGKEVLDMLMN